MVGFRVFDVGLLILWLVWFFRLRDDDDSTDDDGPGGGGPDTPPDNGPGGGGMRPPAGLGQGRPPHARPKAVVREQAAPRPGARAAAVARADQAAGGAGTAGAPPPVNVSCSARARVLGAELLEPVGGGTGLRRRVVGRRVL